MLVSLLAFSCKPFQPALSHADGTKTEMHPVKGRQGILINQKLSFAEFQTAKVRRSWTKGRDANTHVSQGIVEDILFPDMFSINYSERSQTFSFQMEDAAGNTSEVFAASEFASENLQIGSNPNTAVNIYEGLFGAHTDNLFYLQAFINGSETPWQLVLDRVASQENAKNYKGVFVLDRDNFYSLKPITKIVGKKGDVNMPFGSLGFEIFNKNNEFVAAVSEVDRGAVYFNTTDAKERFILANLCAGLLLQQDISE